MEEYALGISKRLVELGFDGSLMGTFSLLACGSRAAALEASGEAWKPHRVVQEYAEFKGITQWAAMQRMRYAMKKAGVGMGLCDFLRQLAKGEG